MSDLEDASQIAPPPSFLALYADPRRQRLTTPLATVRQRYELCEDLAQALVDTARDASHGGTVADEAVLARCHAALSHADAGLAPAETRWVLLRLAELLDWAPPPALA